MSSIVKPGDISLPMAGLAGLWVEGPLYGLSVAVYVCCVKVLLHEGRSMRRNMLLAAATFQLIVASGHYLSFFLYVQDGFIQHASTPGGPLVYLVQTSSRLYVSEVFFYFTQFLMGDILMAWRCYVVWNRNHFVGAFFALTLLATIVSSYGTTAEIRISQSIFSVYKWSTTAFSLSLVNQISATSLIVWRISSQAAWGTFKTQSEHLSVIWMIVESGAVLSGATVAVFTLYLLNMNAGQILTNIDAQLSFIVPMSIIIRVGWKHKRMTSARSLGSDANNVVVLDRVRRRDEIDTFDATAHEASTVGARSDVSKADLTTSFGSQV